MPHDDDGPVFNEPWEAQAFAMTVALSRGGLFEWPEWAETWRRAYLNTPHGKPIEHSAGQVDASH